MKYALIIPDGAADIPQESLGGKTPIEAADTPNMDRVARVGRQGTVRTTPEGYKAGSDICCMALMGYPVREYHTGRAPLEAAALGIELGETDWVFRLNLVTTSAAGGMLDHSAGHISDEEARALLESLQGAWREQEPELAGCFDLYPGVSYRHILVDRSGFDYSALETTPPHEIPDQPFEAHLPDRAGGERIARLMEISAVVFASHGVNAKRRSEGKGEATTAWVWGQGRKPSMPSFADAFGKRACIITAVDLLAGISAYAGITRLDVAGITGYHDTDYAEKGRRGAAALDEFDLVIVHVEAPDEASHQADLETKIAAIEAIDRHVVGPVVKKLESFGLDEQRGVDGGAGGWRVLVVPDHYTRVDTRQHDDTPVPFAMAGSWVRGLVAEDYGETNAQNADLHIAHGHDLMEYFLYSGLKRPTARRND